MHPVQLYKRDLQNQIKQQQRNLCVESDCVDWVTTTRPQQHILKTWLSFVSAKPQSTCRDVNP